MGKELVPLAEGDAGKKGFELSEVLNLFGPLGEDDEDENTEDELGKRKRGDDDDDELLTGGGGGGRVGGAELNS